MNLPFIVEEKSGNMYQHNIDECWKSIFQIEEGECPKCGYDRLFVKEFYKNGVLDGITFKKCTNPRCEYQVDGDGEVVSDMRIAVESF